MAEDAHKQALVALIDAAGRQCAAFDQHVPAVDDVHVGAQKRASWATAYVITHRSVTITGAAVAKAVFGSNGQLWDEFVIQSAERIWLSC